MVSSLQVPVQVQVPVEFVHRQGPDGLVVDLDGYAQKGEFVLLPGAPGAGPVQKKRFLAHPGDHRGLAGLHHPAGDAFPQFVAAPAPGFGGEAVGHLDLQFRGLGVEDGDGAPAHAHALGQDLEHPLQDAGAGGPGRPRFR